ncbi:MAG TPA: MFS transporter [Mycobacteriales bacterium]|nr:MFS transporter [Mycobacteriales bacterium]
MPPGAPVPPPVPPVAPVVPAPAPARRPTVRDVLRHREFRGLVVAQVASELGDHVARVALASLVLARTESAFLAVLAFVASFVPAVFGSALLGTFADRLPRKVVLLACDLARAVVVGVIALLAVDSTPVWLLLLLLLVAETFTAPFEAAHRAVVPDVLPDPRENIVGVGLLRTLYQADQVIGILAAGLVIVFVGERAGLLLDVASFAVSFVVLAVTLRWRPAPVRSEGEHHTLVSDFREGWRLVFDDPALKALVVLAWGAAVFLIAPEAVALAYARDDGAGPAVGAALMASLPAGAALGSSLVARLDPVRQVGLILPLAVSACAPLLLTSLAPPWYVALPLWFVAGASQGFMVPLMTTVNLMSPAALRGRVNGLAGAGFSTVTATTFLLAGAMADLASPAVSVTVAAVIGLALVGAAHRTWPAGALRRAAQRVYASG